MVIWTSDNSDSDKSDSDWDDEAELPPSPATEQERASGAASHCYSIEDYVAMGFPKELVLKGIKNIGKTSGDGDGDDPNALLELLLTYKELGDDSLVGNCSTSGSTPLIVEDGDENDSESWDVGSCGSDVEELLQDISHRDKKVQYLLQMGFPEDEAKMAIKRCGLDSAMSVLIDSIHASQFIGDEHEIKDSNCIDSSLERQKAKLMEDSKKRRKLYGGGAQGNPLVLDCSHEDPMLPPNPMVGFNLPSDPFHSAQRRIPIHATGPPFIYFENMAQAPKGVWDTISQFLDGVKPEYVDSKFFSASTGKRDCLHNLPIDGRYPLPLSRKTIFEALPGYEKWWPSWDPRLQLNCLRTRMASPKLVERISRTLAEDPGNPPAKSVQKYVLGECREWNLVWVGKNRVAPLEPDEMEVLLGYPAHHTRGVCRTKRYRSLRNAFQVDTVAYHLSVLKKMYPDGLNVLSLFSGIGGAEVALHRLGIRMKAVVSVESSAVNRSILKSWWNETQTGRLIEIDRVESLTDERIGSLVRELGGFQLVIGGSPCNNLTGSNRRHRDGLEGEHSVLFHHYVRIARSVKLAMKTTYVLLAFISRTPDNAMDDEEDQDATHTTDGLAVEEQEKLERNAIHEQGSTENDDALGDQ